MSVSVQPGPGIFMLKRPDTSEAHHIFGPVGGTPPARSMSSSVFSTESNLEIEAKAIASSVVSTCSVLAVSPTEISSYVLLSINPRFMTTPSARFVSQSSATCHPTFRCANFQVIAVTQAVALHSTATLGRVEPSIEEEGCETK